MIGVENSNIPKKHTARMVDPIFKNKESNNRKHAKTPSNALHRKKAFAIATSVCIPTMSKKYNVNTMMCIQNKLNNALVGTLFLFLNDSHEGNKPLLA